MTELCYAAEQVKAKLTDYMIDNEDPRYGPKETKALREQVFDNAKLWVMLSKKLEQRFYERALTVAKTEVICNTLSMDDTRQYRFDFRLTLKNNMRQVETMTTQFVVTNGVGEPPESFSLVPKSEFKRS